MSETDCTVGSNGPALLNRATLSVMVPPSPPTPAASTNMLVHLSPRNVIPMPPPSSTLEKVEHSLSPKPPVVDGQVSSPSSWDYETSMDYEDADESLIPTIMPPVDASQFPSGTVYSTTNPSSQEQIEELESMERTIMGKLLQPYTKHISCISNFQPCFCRTSFSRSFQQHHVFRIHAAATVAGSISIRCPESVLPKYLSGRHQF